MKEPQLKLFERCKACDTGVTAARFHRPECKFRRKDGKDAIPIARDQPKR